MNGSPRTPVVSEMIPEKTCFEQLQEFIGYIASSYPHYENFSTILLFFPSLSQLLF